MRILSCPVYHQGNPRVGLLHYSHPATTEGRYHRKGDPGVWYASFRERGAWAELFRHHQSDEISPFEMRRRVGRARTVALVVLDLTDAEVRAYLNVTEEELTGDDYSLCRDIAVAARNAGFDGILGHSAALDIETTLVVFMTEIHEGQLLEEHSRVQRPPSTMAAYRKRIPRNPRPEGEM